MTQASRLIGYPFTQHLTIDTTGQRVDFPGKLLSLQVYNQAAVAMRMYWTLADFGANLAAGVNYIPLAANGNPGDFFDHELTFIPSTGLWLRAETGSGLVVVTGYIESSQ